MLCLDDISAWQLSCVLAAVACDRSCIVRILMPHFGPRRVSLLLHTLLVMSLGAQTSARCGCLLAC